jgi:hypothetical protein
MKYISLSKFNKNIMQHVVVYPSYHTVHHWPLLRLLIYTHLMMVIGPKHVA